MGGRAVFCRAWGLPRLAGIAGGGRGAKDKSLRAYLRGPNLAPPQTACVAERTLHAAMLGNPRRPVAASEIAAIADADARENWTLMIVFRDHLVGYKTVEAAYLDLVRRGMGETPPLFINQLVHVILRNLLDGCDDVFMLRAAELFFRPQRLTVHDGSLIAADEEKVTGISPQPASPLIAMLGLPVAGEIDVLNEGPATSSWDPSALFSMALYLTPTLSCDDASGCGVVTARCRMLARVCVFRCGAGARPRGGPAASPPTTVGQGVNGTPFYAGPPQTNLNHTETPKRSELELPYQHNTY